MSFIRDLRNKFRIKYRYGYAPAYGVSVANMSTAELYRTQPNLRAVVSYLADNAAQIPLKVHDRASDDDRPRVLDSPAALLLADPNPDMTAFELKRAIYSDILLFGTCLVLVLPDADAPSGWQLRHIPATWIVDYRGDWAFSPDIVRISNGANYIDIPRSNFILFHGYDPSDPMRSSSPVESLKDVLFEQVESNRFRRQMWHRGGRFNTYISRPKDVEPFTDETFERFKTSWRESWAGDGASDGGGTPILEDGMEIKQVQFNSRDAQWSDAKKLGREDVAGAYHLNPALIWPGSGQTYASAKDNARALYNECLAPYLMEVTNRLTHDLFRIVGENPRHYVAYDITIKTEGSFEEKIQALVSATGAPLITRDEARARLDLPALGANELIVPLNVIEGGLSSPYDTDPTVTRYDEQPQLKSAPKSYKAAPLDEESEEIADAYKRFFEHQRAVILSKLGAKAADDWWDSDRWNRELSDTLYPVALKLCTRHAKRTLASIDVDADGYSEKRTQAYIRSMCDRRAEMVNDKTKQQLDDVDDWDGDEDAEHATYSGVFDMAENDRSVTAGTATASAIAGFAALEAIRQCAPNQGAQKTWIVTSGNPRPSHAAMDGETVPYSSTFSNGADWPGDTALDAADVANCQCQIEITIP